MYEDRQSGGARQSAPFLARLGATREFLDARRALFRAINFDRKHGVSANKIADMAAPPSASPSSWPTSPPSSYAAMPKSPFARLA